MPSNGIWRPSAKMVRKHDHIHLRCVSFKATVSPARALASPSQAVTPTLVTCLGKICRAFPPRKILCELSCLLGSRTKKNNMKLYFEKMTKSAALHTGRSCEPRTQSAKVVLYVYLGLTKKTKWCALDFVLQTPFIRGGVCSQRREKALQLMHKV